MPFMEFIPSSPEVADRLALSDSQDDEKDHTESRDANRSPYNHLYRTDGKDSEVKEQDTDLGQEYIGRVECLADIDVLNTVRMLPFR